MTDKAIDWRNFDENDLHGWFIDHDIFENFPEDVVFTIAEFAVMEFQAICHGCNILVNLEEDWFTSCYKCNHGYCASCENEMYKLKFSCNDDECYYCRNFTCYNNYSHEYCDICWNKLDKTHVVKCTPDSEFVYDSENNYLFNSIIRRIRFSN